MGCTPSKDEDGPQSVPVNMAADRAVSVFRSIDKDDDGKITSDELLNYMLEEGMDIDDCSSLFSRMDKNKDGFLSLEEFSSGMNMFSSEGGDAKTGEEWDGSHLAKQEASTGGTFRNQTLSCFQD